MAKRRSVKSAATGPVDGDAGAFRAAVSDVTPLPPVSTEHLATPRARKRTARSAAAALAAFDPALLDAADGAAAPEAVTSEGTLSFQRAGVRPQVLRRLRRGAYRIEAELDLHGQTESAARGQLAEFLVHSRDGGCRCVRIVHGKGYRSGARGPVLKSAVNSWLRRSLDVLAFTSARAIDGGTGALYVLLRS
jgi:DNA-nicking Smr family endonuclease